jgi:hypothetical protein
MTLALVTLTLEAFLAQENLEESPAWELIDGRKIQKPMPPCFTRGCNGIW